MELKDLLKIKKPKEGQEESGFIYRKGR